MTDQKPRKAPRYRTTITVYTEGRPPFETRHIKAAFVARYSLLMGTLMPERSLNSVLVTIEPVSKRGSPVVTVTNNYVELKDGGRDLVYWDRAEFDADTVPSIVNAVKILYEEGASALRRILKQSRIIKKVEP